MLTKSIRVFAAMIFFTAITLFFLDFGGFLPIEMHHLAEIQVVPALMTGGAVGFGIAVLWLAATLVFGRIYCSVVCPLGVMQDLISWFEKRIHRKRKYTFRKPQSLLRYGILTACIVGFFVDIHLVVSLLDPYGVYGRMMNSLFQPIAIGANNLLAVICNAQGNYDVYARPIIVSLPTVVVSLGMLFIVGFLAVRFGRMYCNTICPVGSLLGLASRYSLLKIRLHKDCISCGLCEHTCKAECIDSKSKTVDVSRCVACFNCLTVCKRGSLYYGIGSDASAQKHLKTDSPKSLADSQTKGVGQRRAMLGILVAAASACLGAALPPGLTGVSKKSFKKEHPISPPGAGSTKRFQKKCTACHLCVTKCPANVIRPAVDDYGLAGFLQPVISFEHGFCNFDCVICSEVCPNHALEPLERNEKHLLQIGKVNFIKENCIVDSQHTNCGACAEHCPTGAVKMVPFGDPKNALTIPEIDTELCVGCGACEHICPVRPYRAIYVDGNPVHLAAKPAFDPNEKQKEVKVDSFGF